MDIIEKFGPIVAKIARENYINITIDEDDVKQLLWKKVLEVMPRMKFLEEKDFKEQGLLWDDLDRFKWIKGVLNNFIKDVKVAEANTPGASQYSYIETDLTDIAGAEMDSIFDSLVDINQEDVLVGKELYDLVTKWAKDKPEIWQRFIAERLNTSEELEAQWEEKLKTSPRGRNAKSIPIWTMLHMMGINQTDYYKVIRCELQEYLNANGFDYYKTQENRACVV